jgi:Cu-Zn family superoxide dismutase
MPNVVADANGRVDVRIMLHGTALQGPDGILGHAVVLHAAPDDYHTQPTGNSGPRVACGVIAG